MDRVFSNRDAAIAGGFALVEFFALMIYLIVAVRSLTKEIIDRGRLIPTMHTMFVGSGPSQQPYMPAPSYPPQQYTPQQYPPQQYRPPQSNVPSGFGDPGTTTPLQGPFATDNPPSYAEAKQKM